jgi:hypothetical protein
MIEGRRPERSVVLRNGSIVLVVGLVLTIAFLLVALRGATTGVIRPDATPAAEAEAGGG